ncbi:unnamed protein product, partial [Bodo saltans]
MIHSLETNRYAVNAPDSPMDAASVAGLNRLKQFFIPVVAAPDGPSVPSARLLFAWHGTSPDNVVVACRDDHRSLRASDYQFFGAGSYLALEATHAVRFSEQVRGESAMILCAVSVSQAPIADSFVMIHILETNRYAVNAPDNPMDAATVAGLNRLKQFFIPVVAAPDGPPVPSARLLFAWHGTSPDNV